MTDVHKIRDLAEQMSTEALQAHLRIATRSGQDVRANIYSDELRGRRRKRRE
jgi:hypothetical protein